MRALVKKITTPVLQRFAKLYFSKPRTWRYRAMKFTVLPSVFFPHFTISTKVLLDFIDGLNLSNKSLLELGCGTGAISVFASKNGALVTASDINPVAIKNAELNAKSHEVNLLTIQSDLFESIPEQTFDFILINPPYYPRNPKDDAEKAWFCGAAFEYFDRLFDSLKSYINHPSEVYMILSEDCEITHIQMMAKSRNLKMEVVKEVVQQGEQNFIFSLSTSA